MALRDSPRDHTEPPNSTMSLSRNCPGIADSAGKPFKVGSHPGVVSRKERVVAKSPIAGTLPAADAMGET